MKKINLLFNEYGESHQNPTNKRIHWVCVPTIYICITGFLWSIPAGPLQALLGTHPFVNWASVTVIAVILYYLSLSFSIALGMTFFSIASLFIIRLVEVSAIMPVWQLSLIVFVLAWIGQFYGHNVEGKKPSFFKDLQFLFVGPAWLMHFLYEKAGIKY